MTSWDGAEWEREVAAEKVPALRRMILWHQAQTRRKWWLEHSCAITLMGGLFFFFGVAGLCVAIAAFVARELMMALLIEILVKVVMTKARL